MGESDFEQPLLAEEPVIPDSIEPYLGFKALNVDPLGQLHSPSYETVWPIGERLEGACTASLSHWCWMPKEGEPRIMDATVQAQRHGLGLTWATATSAASPAIYSQPPRPNNPLPPGWNWSWEPQTHGVPEESCHCGIYVASDPAKCIQYLGHEGIIVQIALWGKVIPAHSGARGQYGYPQKLLVPQLLAEAAEPTALLYGCSLEILDAEGPVEAPVEPMMNAAQHDDLRAAINEAMSRATQDMP